MALTGLETVWKNARESAAEPPPSPIEWKPLPGPQLMAVESTADIIGFGGAAGGGKSFALLGLALAYHHRSVIFRREAKQLRQLIDDSQQLVGGRGTFNENLLIWRNLPAGNTLEFGGVRDEEDKKNWQGRAHDLKAFDEVTEFSESQFRFLCGWNRTGKGSQRCRIIAAFNPPTTPEGEWVLDYWAPWINEDYQGVKAESGELRWFANIDGRDREVEDARQFVVVDGQPCYEFDPNQFDPTLIERPRSRTFIKARVTDNPYLMATDYIATLQSLDSSLRDKMLLGMFRSNVDENPFQLVPTNRIDDAVKQWEKYGGEPPEGAAMVALGVDVARGGKDNTVFTPLYEGEREINGKKCKVLHFGKQVAYPGKLTTDGRATAELVKAHRKDGAAINIDAIGIGSSPLDFLREEYESKTDPSKPHGWTENVVHAINNGAGAPKVKDPKTHKLVPIRDESGKYEYATLRAFLAMACRRLFMNGEYLIEMPPSREIRSDFQLTTWRVETGKYRVKLKEEIKKEMPDRRSTDYGDSFVLATAHRNMPVKKKSVFKMWVRKTPEEKEAALLAAQSPLL